MDGPDAHHADYRLNQLGIRLDSTHCQLIARCEDGWRPIGPRWALPVYVPRTPEQLADFGGDALRVTAYQYMGTHPDSDLVVRLETRPMCPVTPLQMHKS